MWENFTTEAQWKQYLTLLLKRNDKALKTAIILIYRRQTEEEKMIHKSTEDNGVGFTKWDAEEMTQVAKKLIANKEVTKGEWARARNKMPKYWKQLMLISKEQADAENALKEKQKHKEALEQFERSINILNKCSEDGTPCEYGICDECPVTQGLQLRMKLKI